MIHEVLAVGGLLFWGVVAAIILVMTVQIHKENVGWAVATLALTLVLLFSLTNAGQYLKSVPSIYYIYFVLAWLAISGIWAIIKWRVFYLPKLFRRYNVYRSKFLATAGPNGTPLAEMPADPNVIARFNNTDVKYMDIKNARMVSHNKGRITTWMIFWLPSMIETFIGDFLVNVYEHIYNMIANGLQRMSDSMASKYSELN